MPGARPREEQGLAKVGKYELVRKLATGGMAEVFLAKAEWAMGVERIVVVKRILAHLVEDPSFSEMFLSEAKLASQLSHPNIVQIFEFGDSEGLPYLAMEYVDGPNLRTLATRAFEEGRPLPFRVCAKIISSACEALAYAHELTDLETGAPLQIVHRDISPDNILISRHGAVKVVDFGIAKAVTQSHKTKTGLVKGKVAYMAPEQIKSTKSVDRRADVYALGVVLYELVAGAKPYNAESEISMIHSVLYEPIVPIRERRPEVPEELEAVVTRALAHERDERYADCREMYTDLERYIMTASHEPIGAFQIAQLITELKVVPVGPHGTPPPGMATPNRAAPSAKTPQPSRKEEAPAASKPADELDDEVKTLMDGSDTGLTMRVLANALLSDAADPDAATRPQKALNFEDRTRIERPPERPPSKAHVVPAPAGEPKPVARGASGTHRARTTPPAPVEDRDSPRERAKATPKRVERAEAAPKRAGSRATLIAAACALLLGGGGVTGFVLWPDESQPPGGTITPPPPGPVAEDAGVATGGVDERLVEAEPDAGVEPLLADPRPQPIEPVREEISLTVKSEPSAFIRLLKGKRPLASKRSPLMAKLPPGAYDIEVTEEGEGISKTDRVVLKPGSDPVTHTVEIGKSTLVIHSVPWAYVAVDGNGRYETPAKLEVYEGVHTVAFECSNGKKGTQQVVSKAGEEVKVKSKCSQ